MFWFIELLVLADVGVIVSAFWEPSGETVVFAVTVAVVLIQAALSNCSDCRQALERWGSRRIFGQLDPR